MKIQNYFDVSRLKDVVSHFDVIADEGYIVSAKYDGKELNDIELEWLNMNQQSYINELIREE